VPLDKEKERLLAKLYRVLNDKIMNEAKDGSDETWIRFKDIAKMIYDTSGHWNNLSNIHYYSSDYLIIDSLKEEGIKTEIMFIPHNILPVKIKFLLNRFGFSDLFKECSRVLPDEIAFKVEENEYFIDLANSLFSFLWQTNREADLREKCHEIANISCNHANYLAYALMRDEKIISQWVKTDGILLNGKFWFTGDLGDLGVEVAREICTEFCFEKEEQDFIEKVFVRSENYVRKVLEASQKEYKVLVPKSKNPAPLVGPSGRPSGGSGRRVSTGRALELEKLYIARIREIEEKAGQKTEDVSSEDKGYDIESVGNEGEKYIEVKGITEVKLTDNEYKTALELKDKYWLYVVIKYEPFECRRIQNPGEICKFEKVIVDFRWNVRDWAEKGEIKHIS
jgi:hypothetical protein